MARTISSHVTGPVNLALADNPLTVTSAGMVTSSGTGLDAIDGAAGTTWNIQNSGSLSSSTGYGIALAGSGTVSNNSGGSISGKNALVLRAGGTVSNAAGGSIAGTGVRGADVS